jgi:citronellyl-CoA synthetase
MSQNSVIRTSQILSRLPGLMLQLPSLVKGSMVAKSTNKTKPVGLGLCFDGAVKKNPHGPAILFEDRQLSYTQLNEWVNSISHYLLSQGVVKGDCVAIFIENRPELLACVLACAKIGAVSAMLNTAQKGKVLAHSINITEPKVIIAGEECYQAYEDIRHLPSSIQQHLFLADVDTLASQTHCPHNWLNLAELIKTQGTANPKLSDPITADDPCFYLYTSGTTGLPKAVIFNNGRFMKIFGSFGLSAVRLTKNDRLYVPLPFYHATALGVCWGSVLAQGAGLILTRKFSASNFWPDVKKHKATSFGYVGELCRYLLEQPKQSDDNQHNIRIIVGNGLRPGIWKEFKERFAIKKIMEFYGSSEGNIGFTNLFNFDQTVGVSPFPFAIVKYDRDSEQPVLDNKGNMQKVKKGESGLLIGEITPQSPFHGYTDNGKTQSVIIEGAFKKEDRWFNTGDIMLDMGFRHAQFVDRCGDTFRWKGENVSTTEVEMLVEEVAGISEAIVYGVEIPNTNGRAGMASLKLDGAVADFDFENLVTRLQENMPEYSIPIFLRVNQHISLTGTFKHLKAPLKEKGFDLAKNNCPIYVRLPKSNRYIKLDTATQQKIEQGGFKF